MAVPQRGSKRPGEDPDTNYQNLASRHAAATQTVDLDPEVYDYDGVYDSLRAAKEVKRKPTGGPQYMQHLLHAAEVRKRDQLRAKETMLQKEREAEGEQFADKDKFVTAAYKAQQEEVRRLEEAERKKEEADAERNRRGGGGITTFYKGLMEREEARHQAAIKAVEDKAGSDLAAQEAGEKMEAKLVGDARAAVNEEGQVVDKRQMLSAGLNVKPKPKAAPSQPSTAPVFRQSASMAILSGHGGSKAAMRERQSRMLEAQLKEAAKRAAIDEDTEKEARERAAKSRKTEGEVSSARERYLQRKKDAEAAKLGGRAA